jgi:hypothetical protein
MRQDLPIRPLKVTLKPQIAGYLALGMMRLPTHTAQQRMIAQGIAMR